MTATETEWMRHGTCSQNLDYWDESPALMKLRICRHHCPVREACLSWALDMEADPSTRIDGVVGGTVREGRQRLAAILDRAAR